MATLSSVACCAPSDYNPAGSPCPGFAYFWLLVPDPEMRHSTWASSAVSSPSVCTSLPLADLVSGGVRGGKEINLPQTETVAFSPGEGQTQILEGKPRAVGLGEWEAGGKAG